jgi:hypothetical protein
LSWYEKEDPSSIDWSYKMQIFSDPDLVKMLLDDEGFCKLLFREKLVWGLCLSLNGPVLPIKAYIKKRKHK